MNEIDSSFGSISYSQTLFMVILYVVIGSLSILANTINIIVFSTNQDLRKTFAFIIVLDIGEIVNGISYILTGIGRWTELLLGRFGHPISVFDCFFSRYWPIPLILGTEIPAIMTILVSAERIIAVHRPGHYSSIFNYRNKVILIAATIILILLSLFWAGYSASISNRLTSTSHCGIITSTGKDFSTFHFIFVPSAYIASFLSLCFISYLQKVSFT
uniref:G-protein coupled receptors family 1 profile domain-containing protein n=1 Tax=Panagrolaimus sp. PS1159 TaxID=55785 RepID=A0AC35GM44_9BILA